jgi:hypothetical protein
VYIPPSANEKAATEIVYRTLSNQQARSPDALFLVTGDFNHCNLKTTLPTFHQYVNFPTRKDRTLDLFYSNVKDGYRADKLPPLGLSDHCLTQFLPKYTPLVKRQPPTIKTVHDWSPEPCENLKECFACTDWDVFTDCEDLDECATTVSDFINFCVDTVIPVKEVRCYANNKPWVTKEIKDVLNRKKAAFASGNRDELKAVQKELKRVIREGKEKYKEKLERKLDQNCVKDVWDGMKVITGYSKSKKSDVSDNTVTYANELNDFYARFDSHDFVSEREEVVSSLDNVSNGVYDPITVTVDDVCRVMKTLNVNKAAGPDCIRPKVLKICAEQLCHVFHTLFSMSLSLCKVPSAWKSSCIVPVPKKTIVTCLNDLRPVALTSHVMKVFERLVLPTLRFQVSDFQDPLQFAYRARVGVDDALLFLVNTIYSHLEKSGSYVRIMFFDFSSAFNTIQPHLLAKKLNMMSLHPSTIKWILDYLTNRPQFVRLRKNVISNTVFTFTGAPQGTVLSPFLFTLYTADCRHVHDSCHLQKFSDDSAIVGCVLDNNEEMYREQISLFVKWCDVNFLELNVKKTKEIIIDFRRKKEAVQPVIIKDQPIDIVSEYKYLGVLLDDKLNWSSHAVSVYKKLQSRLYFLRKLRSFHVCNKMLNIFYQSILCSVLTFATVCWGGNALGRDVSKLNKIVKKASSTVGQTLDQFEVLLEKRLANKVKTILDYPEHPLHNTLFRHRSTFSGRFVMPSCTTERFRRSFIPAAVRYLNECERNAK